jgi:hypothetical protein
MGFGFVAAVTEEFCFACCLLDAGCLLSIPLGPENGGDVSIRNVV